ncbi:MAG TPA: cyanophycinase [Bacteroidia bacterium]|jgi:cyanophycinase|nr:cyanophycinase [Bacteroidia bacterium]
MPTQLSKGTLIAIGANENSKNWSAIFQRILKESGKNSPQICLFTLAADVPQQAEFEYQKIFNETQIQNISVINFTAHTEADTPENLDKVKNADIILFVNGSQLKLSSLLGGTHLMARIKSRYVNETNFVIAGIGAGATALSNTMIVSCNASDAMLKGQLELTTGLDLISSIFIDTHFLESGRLGCLTQIVTFNPSALGVGLSENVAIIIKNDEIEVIGTGLITIVDGTQIDYSNVAEIAHGEHITVEGIKVHFLGAGKHFLISAKKLKMLKIAHHLTSA